MINSCMLTTGRLSVTSHIGVQCAYYSILPQPIVSMAKHSTAPIRLSLQFSTQKHNGYKQPQDIIRGGGGGLEGVMLWW